MRSATNRPRRQRSPCLLILPSLFLPLECCLGTIPIKAEKLRPDRKELGSANGSDQSRGQPGTTPEASSSHAHPVGSAPSPDQPVELQDLLLDPAPLSSDAKRHARAISGTRLSFGSATTVSSSSTP